LSFDKGVLLLRTAQPHSRPRSGASPAPRGRRSQQTGATRERIQCAALEAFAQAGFDGASTRAIAARADVTQQLITYHFGSKLALWKAVADRIFVELGARFDARLRGLKGVDDDTTDRLLVREFLSFGAERPELTRLMMHEGGRRGPRLRWLVERHVRPLCLRMRERLLAAQSHGRAVSGDPWQLTYILIGATMLFAQSAEFQLLTGRDPVEPEFLEAHADLVLRLLMPGPPGSAPR
jgi:TetR/AcrR family transcriptional regulator